MVLWIRFVDCEMMCVLIVMWLCGGDLIVDRLCMLVRDSCRVFGMGVVDIVRMCIFCCSFLNFFFCVILKCCFLLIMSRLRFLKVRFLLSSWWVLMRMLILLVVSFLEIVCILVLVCECEIILMCIGKLVNWWVKVFRCWFVRIVVGVSMVI